MARVPPPRVVIPSQGVADAPRERMAPAADPAEVMRRRRPVNSPSTRTESMTSTGIATVMAKNATTADQTNGSPNGQLVAALVANRPSHYRASEAVLLRAEAIPHFSRSQSEALNDFGKGYS